MTRNASESESIPAHVWRVAGVIVLGAFMAGLDTSLVNVGLTTIARTLHGSLSYTQWVSSGYLIALAASLPLCGWLGRRFGPVRLWLFALAAFTVISGLCAASTSLSMLIIGRALQGLTGGLLVPAGQTVVGRAAGPRRMGRVMNTAGIVVILAPAVGPALGGMLIDAISWRWLFLVNVPVGLVAFILGLRVLPTDETHRAGRLDSVGLLLLCSGLPLVTFGIIQASQRHTPASSAVLPTLLVGALSLAAYAVHAWRSPPDRPPILDLALFRTPAYAAAQLSVLFCGASLFGGLIVLPLYYEVLRGRGVLDTGLLLLAYGAGSAASLRLGGVLTDRIGGGVTAVIGLVITVVATLPFAMLGAGANLFLVEALQVIRGVGVSFAGLPVMSSAYAAVESDQLSDATAQANILQRIGGSLGSALFVILLEHHEPPDLRAFHLVFLLLAGTAALAAVWLALEQRRTRLKSE